MLVPDLEEISLDQWGTPNAAPLPGHMVGSVMHGVCTSFVDSVRPYLGCLGRIFSNVQETPPDCICQHICS